VKSLLLRFALVFGVVYPLPFPLDSVPGGDKLDDPYNAAMLPLVQWTGAHVFHIAEPIKAFNNGSGDTTFSWVFTFDVAVFSAVVAIAWLLADRKRADREGGRDRVLHAALRFYLRTYLAANMFVYGIVKLFCHQFPALTAARVFMNVGDASPMGLLWRTMSYSPAYEMFAGALETTAALLLCFRRTTTVGALLASSVMANVVMLNFCFDVPVKIYSTQLLACCALLLAPDARGLVDFLLRKRTATPVVDVPVIQRTWVRRVVVGVQALLLVAVVAGEVIGDVSRDRAAREAEQKASLIGAFDVDSFAIDGLDRAAVVGDAKVWRRVGADAFGRFFVQRCDDSRSWFMLDDDKAKPTIVFTTAEEPKKSYTFTRTKLEGDRVLLWGVIDGVEIRARLHRIDDSKVLLLSRGFHWINETPLNR
jgi:hypothetical protein